MTSCMMLFHNGLRIAMPKMPATVQIFRAPLLIPFFFFAPFNDLADVLGVQVSFLAYSVSESRW